MSFHGTLDEAKDFAKRGSKQIDGLEPGGTSPVQTGGGLEGAAPIKEADGTEFTKERIRNENVPKQGFRRRYK